MLQMITINGSGAVKIVESVQEGDGGTSPAGSPSHCAKLPASWRGEKNILLPSASVLLLLMVMRAI